MVRNKLVEYIRINHHLCTLSEMSEETGQTMETIKFILSENDWQAVTIAERMQEFIDKNKHLSLKEQAKKADITEDGLKYHYKKLGIELPEKQKKKTTQEQIEEYKQEQMVEEKKTVINRKAFTVYNQTGSDLLDEYRGIKTTQRNDKLLI